MLRERVINNPHMPKRWAFKQRSTRPWMATNLDTSTCPHPDAIKRRLQAEERETRRRQELESELAGRKWWHDDSIRLIRSTEEYVQLIQANNTSNNVLVINFFSEECYSCKTLHPKLKRIAESCQGEVIFVKINGSDPRFQDLFREVGITAVPWFHLYLNGNLSASLSASLNPERLQRFRDQISLLRCNAADAVR